MNNKCSPTPYVYFVAIITSIAGLLFGFDTGTISGAILFMTDDFHLTAQTTGLVVSSMLIGATIGSMTSGRLTDLLGRRKMLLACCVLYVVGIFISASAATVNAIYLGRLLIGLTIGIMSYTAPLYIAEVSPSESRGMLVTFFQLMITFGILISYIISFIFSSTNGSWRLLLTAGLVPACVFGAGMLFLPESPRWLLTQGKTQQATKILQRLRKKENVTHEINEIEHTLTYKKAPLRELLSPTIRPVLLLGFMLSFVQQATGVNTIFYYAPTIFQLAGFHGETTSILATVGVAVVNVLATFIAVFYMDKLGRRPLLLAGLTGMFAALAGLSLAFHYGANTELLGWLAVACIFIFAISFAFSLGAILWVVVSEIFPLDVRGTAMGLAIATCWFWNVIVTSTFLTLVNKFGPSQTYMMYAAMCVLGFIICYFKVPETKGASLEQIEENIRKRVPLRMIGEHST